MNPTTRSHPASHGARPPCRPRTAVGRSATLGLAATLATLFATALATTIAWADASVPSPVPVPVDVVFVLDNSGSMKSNDPSFLTREAVFGFAATLAENRDVDGRIGLVLFDEDANLAQPLTSVGQLIGDRDLERALRNLDFSGQRTHSPAGIERALYELRSRGREDARKAIVFLSDGKIDTGDSRNDLEAARWLKEDLAGESEAEDVRIFGIAFTESADYQLMQALARRTRARYYRAFEADELPSVVADVLATVEEAPAYDLAYIEPLARPDAPRAADADAAGSAGANPLPDVAASPLRGPEGDLASRLLGWLPVALLLVGAAYYWRTRHASGRPWQQNAALAPPAQLLDPGGVLGEAGAALPLELGRTTIGRDPSNDIVLSDDTISSEHAAIEVRDGRYWLTDLRSTNGTRHADRRLARDERVALKGGDHIRFAEIDLMFVIEGYVPGGATVYLSSSTNPPADWSSLAERTGDQPAPRADRPDPARSEPAEAPLRDAASQEILFAEHRERLDPASVLDLDEELGALGGRDETANTHEDDSQDNSKDNSQGNSKGNAQNSASDRARSDADAVAHAESVLARIRAQDAGATAPDTAQENVREEARGEARENAQGAAREEVRDGPQERVQEVAPKAARESRGRGHRPSESASAGRPRLALLSDPDDGPTAPNRIPETGSGTGSASGDDAAQHAAPDREESTEPNLPNEVGDLAARREEAATEEPIAVAQNPLRRCLDLHLSRVAELSPAFAEFVDRAFHEELRDALPVAAHDLLRDAHESGRIEQRSYTFDRVRYLICGVPGAMESARERFGADYGGFTRVLTEQLQAESFRTERCEILAVLSFGAADPLPPSELSSAAQPTGRSAQSQDAPSSDTAGSPWVSLTIVPDEGQDPRIDLLSYEFLTEAERAQIEPSVDHEISQSGLA